MHRQSLYRPESFHLSTSQNFDYRGHERLYKGNKEDWKKPA